MVILSLNSSTLLSTESQVAIRNVARKSICAAASRSTNNWDIEPGHLSLTHEVMTEVAVTAAVFYSVLKNLRTKFSIYEI